MSDASSPPASAFPDLADLARRVAPIIVTAPTARNGITLVQRLLNSTRRCIIYGENLHLVQTLPNLAIGHVNIHQRYGRQFAEAKDRILRGETEFWSSNVAPDTHAMMQLSLGWFASAVQVYETASKRDGFGQWGIKNPMPAPETIDCLHAMLPRAKFLFVYRDPFEAAASAKARRFITSRDDLLAFARMWRDHAAAVLARPAAHVLPVLHSRLTGDAEAMLAEIEAFTGLASIDRAVLRRKINTFTGQADAGYSPTGYIAPEPLTSEEARAFRAELGDAVQYAAPPAAGASAAPAACG